MADAKEETVKKAFARVKLLFRHEVALTPQAETELKRIVDMTVGWKANEDSGVWNRLAFQDFVVAQFGIIARTARTNAGAKAGDEKPEISRKALVAAAVPVMQATHDIYMGTRGGCDVRPGDEHVEGLPGDGTSSGPGCPLYIDRIAKEGAITD